MSKRFWIPLLIGAGVVLWDHEAVSARLIGGILIGVSAWTNGFDAERGTRHPWLAMFGSTRARGYPVLLLTALGAVLMELPMPGYARLAAAWLFCSAVLVGIQREGMRVASLPDGQWLLRDELTYGATGSTLAAGVAALVVWCGRGQVNPVWLVLAFANLAFVTVIGQPVQLTAWQIAAAEGRRRVRVE